eukprot:m.322227 g.322227  ORF g.322227 m.322227 type:complete len:102 (-) comp19715_c0_seq2:1205-1510(-)
MSGYTNKLPDMGMGAPEDLPEVARAEPAETLAMLKHASMRCGGCGAKVGATVLSRVLKKLDVPMREEVGTGFLLSSSSREVQLLSGIAILASLQALNLLRL